MVVAQLVERLLPIPEVLGSNPVISKYYILSTVGKMPRMAQFTKACTKGRKIK